VEPIRVLVAGATGRAGRAVTRGVLADDDLLLVGAVGREAAGSDVGTALGGTETGVTIRSDAARALDESRPDVLVDFTLPEVAPVHVLAALERGVRPVVGTTGLSDADLERIKSECAARDLGAVVCANFSIGAMLLARFARQAASYFRRCEIVELHHENKVDAPSGTARSIADRVGQVTGREVPVHSVRLPGCVAHNAVLFGGTGQLLTIRHDATSHDSYVAGVLAAVKAVKNITGVVRDLETVLEAAPPLR